MNANDVCIFVAMLHNFLGKGSRCLSGTWHLAILAIVHEDRSYTLWEMHIMCSMKILIRIPLNIHCKCDWTDTGAKQGFSQHTAEVSTDATDMSEHDMSVAIELSSAIWWENPCLAPALVHSHLQCNLGSKWPTGYGVQALHTVFPITENITMNFGG